MSAVATFAMTVAGTVTASAAVAAAEWARRASARSARSERLLTGEAEGDDGVLQISKENRDALIYADLYPPKATDGGERERETDE